MGAQAFKKFTQGTGARGEHRGAFAIGKEHRAVLVFDVNRPDRFYGVEPGRFIQPKAARRKFGLHRANGGFERDVFARDEAFGLHEGSAKK